MESPFPDDETTQTIARCVEAMGDLDRLRDELHGLRLSSDPRAQFATALFDLDRAQRGDPEARNELIDVADRLLVFWREGSGLELAKGIPELEELWASAASLLVSFEQKRFKKALRTCWEGRGNPSLLKEAIEELQPSGNRRVEFARCLYHLELARQFVESSRVEFARRAGLLSEAYQVEEIAAELVGDDEGLGHLWNELKPYLDEFFETMEEEAARRARKQAIAAAEAEIAAQRDSGAMGPVRDFLKTDPGTIAVVQPPELAEAEQVPSFRTLMERTGSGEFAAVPPQPLSEENLIEPVEAVDELAAPPPPPPALTPAELPAIEPADDVVDLVEEAEALLPPPPAPLDLTPPGQWIPGTDGDVEIVESDEAPPPPPALTPAAGIPLPPRRHSQLDLVIDEPDPDADTIAFWHFTTKKLDLLPDPRQPRAARRLLNVENRADRKRLTEYLEAAEPYGKQNADARAFACLLRLMLAGQLKEKSLFGQPNARRSEAFAQALALLSTNPRAAGHGAVWFELDGPETLTALQKGLEVLTRFLTWCASERRDPLDDSAQAEFLGATS